MKNKELQKELFPNIDDPKLCDCIIQKIINIRNKRLEYLKYENQAIAL